METTASRAAPTRRLARPGLKRPRTPTQLKEEPNDHFVWQQQQLLGAIDPSAAARHRSRDAVQGGEGASAAGGAKDDGSVGIGEGGSRGQLRGPERRRRSAATSPRSAATSPLPRRRAAATAVLAAALLRAAAVVTAATATSPLPADFRPAATAPSSRLCSPAEDSRAYVTTIAAIGGGVGASGSNGDKSGDRLLGARVLAQSLRSAGAKGDIVVLVPLERASGPTVDSLRRDGLTVQIVPRGLQSGKQVLFCAVLIIEPLPLHSSTRTLLLFSPHSCVMQHLRLTFDAHADSYIWE